MVPFPTQSHNTERPVLTEILRLPDPRLCCRSHGKGSPTAQVKIDALPIRQKIKLADIEQAPMKAATA